MGRIKCEYCGSFIDDSLAKCPHCGAVNQHMVRYANKTPKTIDELKEWYTARNLPPESVTRFFIGKNVKEPRAFGIYQEGSKFIVYKNKSDGTRAIRYSGNDETYAVNEIYMKLKEEILNQKRQNLSAKSTAARSSSPHRSPGRIRLRLSPGLIRAIVILLVLLIFGRAADNGNFRSSGYYTNGSRDAVYYYYNDEGSEWWHYEPDTDEWVLEKDIDSEDEYPDGLGEENLTDYDTIRNSLGRDFTAFTSSRAYYENHHPYVDGGYYQTDNALYYYLINSYGSGSGWYLYNDGWEYLGDEDLNTVGEDLWYHTEEYYSGDTFDSLDSDRSYYFSDVESWNADFTESSYYEQYQSDYDEYWSTHSTSSYDNDDDSWNSGWDNDSSWDWDSGDSWDSGWSDWDSDW